jgi:hypothetical protein
MKRLIGTLCFLLLPTGAVAQDAATIIDQARDAQRLGNTIQTVNMVLVSKTGREQTRSLDLRTLRDGDVVKTYARFLSPGDVAGTQFVLIDHPDSVDEQLMYLPALDRVTRISGKGRSGSFMGSDFNYEDLEIDSDGAAKHTIVSETDSEWLIETIPGPGSSYTRLRTTIAKADKIPRRVEYFDKAGNLSRELRVEEIREVEGVKIPTKTIMENKRRGTSTRMEVVEIRANVPAEELPDAIFTSAYMEDNG